MFTYLILLYKYDFWREKKLIFLPLVLFVQYIWSIIWQQAEHLYFKQRKIFIIIMIIGVYYFSLDEQMSRLTRQLGSSSAFSGRLQATRQLLCGKAASHLGNQTAGHLGSYQTAMQLGRKTTKPFRQLDTLRQVDNWTFKQLDNQTPKQVDSWTLRKLNSLTNRQLNSWKNRKLRSLTASLDKYSKVK